MTDEELLQAEQRAEWLWNRRKWYDQSDFKAISQTSLFLRGLVEKYGSKDAHARANGVPDGAIVIVREDGEEWADAVSRVLDIAVVPWQRGKLNER